MIDIEDKIIYSVDNCDIVNGTITIQEDITEIGDFAFCGCTELTTLTLPESVIKIGKCAFEGCYNLETINLPNHVTSIGERAFEKCRSLTKECKQYIVDKLVEAYRNNLPDKIFT